MIRLSILAAATLTIWSSAATAQIDSSLVRLQRLEQNSQPLPVPQSKIVPCDQSTIRFSVESAALNSNYWRSHEMMGANYFWTVHNIGENFCARLHSPANLELSPAEFGFLERVSRANSGVIPEVAADSDVPESRLAIPGAVGRLYPTKCENVANSLTVRSAFFVRKNLAVTSGSAFFENPSDVCVGYGSRFYSVVRRSFNIPSAPGVSIAFLELSNNEGGIFAIEGSGGNLPNIQADATIQNIRGSVSGSTTVNFDDPLYLTTNGQNAIGDFRQSIGGLTLYPTGGLFPAPTSVKGVHIISGGLAPTNMLSKTFVPSDALRISAHPGITNPVQISSIVPGTTYYANNSSIPLSANVDSSWKINGTNVGNPGFVSNAQLLPGNNIITASAAGSEISILVRRDLNLGTRFLSTQLPSGLPIGVSYQVGELQFASPELGLGSVDLFQVSPGSTQEVSVPFQISSGAFVAPIGIATVTVRPGVNRFLLRKKVLGELLDSVQATVEGTNLELLGLRYGEIPCPPTPPPPPPPIGGVSVIPFQIGGSVCIRAKVTSPLVPDRRIQIQEMVAASCPEKTPLSSDDGMYDFISMLYVQAKPCLGSDTIQMRARACSGSVCGNWLIGSQQSKRSPY